MIITKVLAIVVITFVIYLGIATRWTFTPTWTIDYFNLYAEALRNGRFDIVNPPQTYDLINFRGKWFAPWGPLSGVALIPFQLIKGRYISTLYLSIISASINAGIVYLLLKRVRKDYFPKMKNWEVFALLAFFLFGTTHVYVGTIGSSWHVDQMVTSVLGTLGIYTIFKRKRTINDYRISSFIFASTLLGRPTYVLLLLLPIVLYLFDVRQKKTIISAVSIFGIPLAVFSILFFSYNYIRFGDFLEYGYRYIREASYLEARRLSQGTFSLSNLTYNAWYMLFEIPKITRDGPNYFDFNLKGNSIFFLSPPLLAIFLARPHREVLALWLTAIATMLPSLMVYSTGWMQFGYRYTLDITVILLLLVVFGIKGKVNILLMLGTVFSIWVYGQGIHALQ